MTEQQAVLHKAIETGQSRELKKDEVLSFALMSAIESLTIAGAAGISAAVIKGATSGDPLLSWETFGLFVGVGGVVGGLSFFFNLTGNMSELREGLSSFREAESYAPLPPKPQEQPSPWRPPIPVTSGDQRGMLDMNEAPQLPDGRDAQLTPTPESMAVILAEVLDRHGGQWSRKRLMSIRVDGKRITRKLYEQLTSDLAKVGFLRERPTGGFELPTDVRGYADLVRYFPSLPRPEGAGVPSTPARMAGWRAGRNGGSSNHPNLPIGEWARWPSGAKTVGWSVVAT